MNSMTGYGRSSIESGGRSITVEIKSVNHRFLDLAMKMPRSISFIEDDIRKMTASYIARGHLEIVITYINHTKDACIVHTNTDLATGYKDAILKISEVLGLQADISISDILSLPDVLSLSEPEEDYDTLRTLVLNTYETALKQVVAMRSLEGNKLTQDLIEKANTLENIILQIKASSKSTVSYYREKLHQRLSSLLNGELDESRFLTEIVIFADRIAIDEEVVRMNSHLFQFRQLLKSDEPIGKKLDFLVQEFNREVNTIGSKALDSTITSYVVSAKNEIEKMREQIQNLE